MTFWVNKLNEGTELQSSEVVENVPRRRWSRRMKAALLHDASTVVCLVNQPVCQPANLSVIAKKPRKHIKSDRGFFETLILSWDCIIPHSSVCKINLMFFFNIFGFTIFFTKCLLIWWENHKKRNYPPSQFNDSKYCAHMFWRNDKGTYSLW